MPLLVAFLMCLVHLMALTHTEAASGLSMVNYSQCIATCLGISANVDVDSNYNYSPLYNILSCEFEGGLSILENYCITKNEITGLTEIGQCPYDYGRGKNFLVDIPNSLSEFTADVCGSLNRSGTLCGKCKDGWYPFAYSIDVYCVPCSHGKFNWWKLILAAFLPLTLFYFLVLFFKINVTSSYLQGFILFSQAVSLPAMVRPAVHSIEFPAIQTVYRVFCGLCGLWHLDMLRFTDLGICLKITSLQVVVFDLAVGVYPTLLIILTFILIELYDRHVRLLVILWKPFKPLLHLFDRNLNIKTSIVDAFATFFVLSSMKILAASYDLLAPVKVYQINSTGHLSYSWRLYYDATVPYFGKKHLPYAILAILSYFVLAVLPILLLLLYSFHWFQKFLNLFSLRWYILHTFMDSFCGCYKDGTVPGTSDYRWFASILWLVRIFLVATGFLTLGSTYFLFAPFVLVVTVVFMIQFQPYKPNFKSLSSINLMFCLLLSLFYICALGALVNRRLEIDYMFNAMAALTGAVNFMYVVGIFLHWIYSHRNFGLEWFRRVKARVAGYSRILY